MSIETKRIFVSNRLPFSINSKTGEIQRGSGGLVSALLGVNLKKPFSWLGFETNEKHVRIIRRRASELTPNLQCHPVILNRDVYDRYYDGFSNDLIWPLFHYEGHLAVFDRENWDAYVYANRMMAEEILKIANDRDTVWIHDFHFLMLPQFLREKAPYLKIGFFLHIPFPSSEVFRQLPVREDIMRSMAQCDLIGFHEHSYLRHFIVALKSVLGVNSSLFKAEVGSHTLNLGVYPISIDGESYMRKANSPDVAALVQQYREKSTVPFLVLGVDRMDYTKGLELKLRGFQRALRKYPDLIGNISLLQVAVPSRQRVPYYGKIKRDLDQLVGQINGEFGQLHYMPVQYIFNSVEESSLIALYRNAQAALITSKRDGMNLVSMEFVMAQDLDHPGVLILSEFAGAASFLGEALIINPWDVEAVADALYKAYTMKFEERRERLSNLQTILSRYSATKWAEGFLHDLDETEKEIPKPVIFLSARRLEWPSHFARILKRQSKLRLVVDYDGTLVALTKKPEQALIQEETLKLLEELQKKMEIYVVSGRSRAFLDSQFRDGKYFFVAEHGAFIKPVRGEWQPQIASDTQVWYTQVEKVMMDYTERVPLSFIEKKEASIVWHFRESPQDFASFQAKKLDDELQIGMANAPVTIVMGDKIVEAKATECNKGRFLRSLIDFSDEDYFYICLGDDRTDEDMFKALDSEGISIKVGLGPTQAKFRLQNQGQVLKFFEELKGFLDEKDLVSSEQRRWL